MTEEKGEKLILLPKTNILLTEEEKDLIIREVKTLGKGVTAVSPIVCAGYECPYENTCVFIKIDSESDGPKGEKVPIGTSCPVEEKLLQWWTEDYLNEYNVDPKARPSQARLVAQLADLELLESRATKLLGKLENQSMMEEKVVDFDAETDEPIINRHINTTLELRERFQVRREKLLRELVGTPRERYKREAALKRRTGEDPSTKMADLRVLIKKEVKRQKEETG